MPLFRISRRSYVPLPLEIFAATLGRMLYRVRTLGAENVPATGGAVLVANHLSYVDVVALQLACRRPIRFLADAGLADHGLFRAAFRLAGVLGISRGRPIDGIRRAVRAVEAGELLCVFPEGSISRSGQLMTLQSGFELIARKAGAPVVPAAIDGLWGSIFSFAGNRYLWKSPRLLPTPVCVSFGRPLAAERAGADAVRRALMNEAERAFQERPLLRRHLGREVVRSLARRPGRVAVVDWTAGRRAVTAAQLIAASAVLSRRLRATIPERRVGIVLPPGVGACIANLAVMCAGKIPVNLNFTAGRASIEASLRSAGIGAVISADAMREKAPAFPWPRRTVDLRAEIAAAGGKRALLPWLAVAWLLPNQWVADLLGLPRAGDRSEAALLFTSGSVGEPKGVVLSHRNLLANCAQISSLSILPDSAILLGSLPVFHSFGFTVTMWYVLLRGCRVVTIPSPLDTRRMIDAIAAERVSVIVGAPSFLRPLLRKARPAELKSVDLVVSGAEKLTEELARAFVRTFHLEILEGYGLTETSPVANVNQPATAMTTASAEPQTAGKAGTVGRLMPGLAARILDPESGAELPPGRRGIVCFRGANVFGGYLDREEATRAVLADGWFATGDLGSFDRDGFLTIEGRLSRFSKIAGEMVPHGGVEQKLAEALGLDPGAPPSLFVAGVADPAKGEALVLLTALDLSPAQVREKLIAAGLPNLWIPRIVRRVGAIPVLGSGKPDLAACRRLAGAP